MLEKPSCIKKKRNMTQIYQQMQKSGWNLSWHIPYKLALLKFKTRSVVVHWIDEQWQIDLVDVSKISVHNDGSKFILVMIDSLNKCAWLESLKSKHGTAIEHIRAWWKLS